MKTRRFLPFLAPLLLTSIAGAQTPAFDRSGETVVLRYQEIIGSLAADDPGPRVEVYGDGRVVTHYPAYMKNAGTYESRIPPEQVETLVAAAVASGLVDFDHDATAAAVRDAETKRRVQKRVSDQAILTHVSDPSTTVIEAVLLPPDGRRSGTSVAAARWTGLEHDAERFPEIESLRELAELEKKLRGLMAKPGESGQDQE